MRAAGLLSATYHHPGHPYHQPGHQHLVEIIHQNDDTRWLESLTVTAYGADGGQLDEWEPKAASHVDLGRYDTAAQRVMVLFDARYDERIFPYYRPHHYGYLVTDQAPLYYALNAVLGGVPARIGATGINNFEHYILPSHPPAATAFSVLIGNVSRLAEAKIGVTMRTLAGLTARQSVVLAPKAHTEVALLPGTRLVEVHAPFRAATYIVGRSGDMLTLFDHLFVYRTGDENA